MASDAFYIKQGDTRPFLKRALKNADGSVIVLTGATVNFHMGLTLADLKINRAALVTDGPAGEVEYRWVTGDTDTPGIYLSEFEVDFGGGAIITVPNGGYMNVHVTEELA